MEILYKEINAPIYRTELAVAEIIKYVNNSFHALKITFANEVGNICKELNIDSHQVMEIFCKDTRLNISPYYLKPGFAYGGSCLPKDLKALVSLANKLNVVTPVLNNIQPSNELQKEKVLKDIIKHGKKNIGVLGLSFKAGTDDLRESPMVDLAERLLGKGYTVKIHDNNIQLSKLVGANKSYIETHLPHLSSLLVSLEELLQTSEVIVIATKENDYKLLMNPSEAMTLQLRPETNQVVYDLVRIAEKVNYEGEYVGIFW